MGLGAAMHCLTLAKVIEQERARMVRLDIDPGPVLDRASVKARESVRRFEDVLRDEVEAAIREVRT